MFTPSVRSSIDSKRKGVTEDAYNYLKKYIDPKLIIDIGAGMGTAELYERFPKCDIYTIEPIEELCNILKASGYKKRIKKMFNGACLDFKGQVDLNIHPDVLASSTVLEKGTNKLTNGFKRNVDVDKLDNLFFDDIKSFDGEIILKIDVQGPNLDVIRGSNNILLSGKIAAILIELYIHDLFDTKESCNPYQVFKLLDSYGFRIFDLHSLYFAPSDNALVQFDAIFLKKESSAFLDRIAETDSQRIISNRECIERYENLGLNKFEE